MATIRQHVHIYLKRNISYSQSSTLLRNSTSINTYFTRKLNNEPHNYTANRDPAPLFFNKDIQNILKKLTRINMNKVFKHRHLENTKVETPLVKFMTDDELKAALDESAELANEVLQMPPVVKIREPINEILSKDPALQGYSDAKFVFTDITYGISDQDRLILVRDPDGTLSKADWDVRHRMCQIYFPQPGRELVTPLMFQDDYLKSLLDRKEYEFILDRACIQFEPNDSEYQRLTSLIYQHINDHNDFEALRSTRHFGPFVFFLAWTKSIDNLLVDFISTSYINEANCLISLYNLLNSKDAVGKNVNLKSEDDTNIIELYIKEKSLKKGQLELAMQTYREQLKQKQELEKGLKKAHGIS